MNPTLADTVITLGGAETFILRGAALVLAGGVWWRYLRPVAKACATLADIAHHFEPDSGESLYDRVTGAETAATNALHAATEAQGHAGRCEELLVQMAEHHTADSAEVWMAITDLGGERRRTAPRKTAEQRRAAAARRARDRRDRSA